jgi:hypothetical protein
LGAKVYPINSVDVHSYNDSNLERYTRDTYGFNATLAQSFNKETYDSLYPLLTNYFKTDGTAKILIESAPLRKITGINHFLFTMPLVEDVSLFSGLRPTDGKIKRKIDFKTTPYTPRLGSLVLISTTSAVLEIRPYDSTAYNGQVTYSTDSPL